MLDDRIGPSFRQSFPLLLHLFSSYPPFPLPYIISSFPWTIVQRYRIFLKRSKKKRKNLRYIFYLPQQCNKFSSHSGRLLTDLFLSIFSGWNEKFRKNSRAKGDARRNYGTGERIFESVDELRGTWPPILGGLESWSITRARLGWENSSEAGLF